MSVPRPDLVVFDADDDERSCARDAWAGERFGLDRQEAIRWYTWHG